MSQTLSTEQRIEAREIARSEIASLCGLVMRRVQDLDSLGDEVLATHLAGIFGEALRDFGGTPDEPGEAT